MFDGDKVRKATGGSAYIISSELNLGSAAVITLLIFPGHTYIKRLWWATLIGTNFFNRRGSNRK